MSSGWECTLTGKGIEVSWKGTRKGAYKLIEEPYCYRCSFPGVKTAVCKQHSLDDGIARTFTVGIYLTLASGKSGEDLLSRHILGLKSWKSRAVPLGKAMSICAKKLYPEILTSDYLVPVPRHPDEMKIDRDSGEKYNQSFELANTLASEISVKINDTLVKKRVQGMHGLNLVQRWQAAKDLYDCPNGKNFRGRTVTLIDDVRTTAASTATLAGLLTRVGASKVYVFVAGRGKL